MRETSLDALHGLATLLKRHLSHILLISQAIRGSVVAFSLTQKSMNHFHLLNATSLSLTILNGGKLLP